MMNGLRADDLDLRKQIGILHTTQRTVARSADLTVRQVRKRGVPS
jgi:hypothetical protein